MNISRPYATFLFLITCGAALPQDIGTEFFRDRLVAPPDPVGYARNVQEAISLYSSQRFDKAASAFGRALEAYPKDGTIWIYYAFALRGAKRPKEAIAAFDRGHSLRSTWQGIRTYYWLARTYMDASDRQGALKALHHLVFEEPWISRQGLYEDEAFASLRTDPQFAKLCGKVDTSKMSRTEGWRTDIEYLLAEIKRVNHKYHDEPFPKEVLNREAVLKREIPKLSDDEMFLRLGHMIAPLNQAHMSMALGTDSKHSPLRTLPITVYAFPDGAYVVAAEPAFSKLVGFRIDAIERREPGDILTRLERYKCVENPMKAVWGAQDMCVMQMLRGLGVVKPGADNATLTMRSPSGVVEQVTMPFGDYKHERKLHAAPGVPAPRFTRDVERLHWFEPIEDGSVLYVQLNQVADDKDETLNAFGLKLRSYLRDHPTKNVILDVRHNNGGNTALYLELLRTLVSFSTTEGNKLYVLIGRGVYSATGNLITELERLVSPTFVGEPSSGFGNQDGDESSVTLPYSGIHCWLASVWWQTSHPWDKRRSIEPDVPVQLTAKSYFAGRDSVLETVLEMIKSGGPG